MVFVFVVLGVPSALIGIPWSALRRNFSLMYRMGMASIRAGLAFAGIPVRVVGMENVPAGQSCIFMSNHTSNLDPPVLKKSLMKIPLLGTAMRMGKFVPVARGHSRDEAVKSVEAAKDALASGLHIMVFPEGTRSPDGKLLPFKKGAFFLAAETGAPMVPVVIHGTRAMMPKGTLKTKKGSATVEFLPAILPSEYDTREELMEAVRAAMEKAL